MNEKKTDFKGMPKLLEGVINALIRRCKGRDISSEKLILNSTTSIINHRGLKQELLVLRGCAFGCRKDLYDKNLNGIRNDPKNYFSRRDDANVNSQWIANGKIYYTWNEQAYENGFENFITEFNRLYLGEYKINCINPYEKNKTFSLFEFSEDKTHENEGTPKMIFSKSVRQKILFGAPGTGKSFKIEDPEKGYGLKDVDDGRKYRTTFHPDYDYAQFVGAYKPKKEGEKVTYSFVPQVFAKAYVTAWKLYFSAGNVSTAENQVYLVIEEINRGNCAQIFGDIFQLLDRSNEDDEKGFSQYSIDADCDFAEWLKKYSDLSLDSFWAEYMKKLGGEGKLKLPPNLNILATMNTSDQSLFPMDSAFKRRFDWEYVPISFVNKDGSKKEAADYKIEVSEVGEPYSWKNFVEIINKKILNVTKSEDKQLGEFFVKPDKKDEEGKLLISEERFLGKVMFYLWNDVCKDEHENESFFRTKDDGYFTFQDFYKLEKKGLLKKFMDELMKEEG